MAIEHDVAVPAFASPLAYYAGLRRCCAPANLLQGCAIVSARTRIAGPTARGIFITRRGRDGAEVAIGARLQLR
jgi:hypothetical protein